VDEVVEENMARYDHHQLRLDVGRPVALAGGDRSMWAADASPPSLVELEPARAARRRALPLDARPLAVAVAGGTVAAATGDGRLMAYDAASGELRFELATGAADPVLAAAGDVLWLLDRRRGRLLAVDLEGRERARLAAPGAVAIAAAENGVFWLSGRDATLHHHDLARGEARAVTLDLGGAGAGAIVFCANAVWVALPGELLLIPAYSLRPGPRLSVPLERVEHLACTDQRLVAGADDGLVLLDPAADQAAQRLDLTFPHGLAHLAAAADHLWAVERDEPIAHVLRIY